MGENVKENDESWKDYYYNDKFHISIKNKEFCESIKKSYIEGLVWVLNYYHHGCISWNWYYPYHYAPLISGKKIIIRKKIIKNFTDLKNLESIKIEFTLNKPFLPFQQLLAVLPRASSNLIPLPYRNLMLNSS